MLWTYLRILPCCEKNFLIWMCNWDIYIFFLLHFNFINPCKCYIGMHIFLSGLCKPVHHGLAMYPLLWARIDRRWREIISQPRQHMPTEQEFIVQDSIGTGNPFIDQTTGGIIWRSTNCHVLIFSHTPPKTHNLKSYHLSQNFSCCRGPWDNQLFTQTAGFCRITLLPKLQYFF